MARPQPGIFAQGTRSHYHLEFDLRSDAADGEELEIYRRSVPYGRVGELGLSFVAFSADPSRFTKMLARMFGTIGGGLHDRLTDFSRPVSGSWYFAPSLDALDGIFPED